MELRDLNTGIEGERILETIAGNVCAPGKTRQGEIGGVELHMRTSALAIRLESDSGGDAAGHTDAYQALQIAELRHCQRQLALGTGVFGNRDIAIRVNAFPICLT